MLADLFPTTIDSHGVLIVMIEFTLAILIVVGVAIAIFARWSRREKAKRAKDINTALNLKR